MYKDLREFIDFVDRLGALRRIDGADPLFEIGGITEVAAGRADCPALLFDSIKGYRPGMRVFTQRHHQCPTGGAGAGPGPGTAATRRTQSVDGESRHLRSLPPVTVGNADVFCRTRCRLRCRYRALSGADLAQTRRRTLHRLGFGCGHRDPDTGWINASIYRVQVHGPDKVTVQFDHGGRHGAIIARKYWDRGESCPVAVVHGEDPALFIAGFEYLPDGSSEYGFAGAIKGTPIEVCAGPNTGLPLPAHAEMVFEGRLLPMTGRHPAGRPVRRVHRLLRRRGAPPVQ